MTTSAYPQGHALIVAVAAYQHISPLSSVVLNDAKDVACILGSPQHCGYSAANIVQLLDGSATRVAVLAGLADLAARAGTDDTACVYFSGHGGLTGGADPDESSLLTVDCQLANLAGTSIGAAELSDALQQIKTKRLIVFLDACHAAGAGALKGPPLADKLKLGYSEKTLTRLAEGAGRALMASSKPSETSLIMPGARNSAFTAALLAGLGGAADARGVGVIRVFDLFEYVAAEVTRATADAQHPIFKANHLEQNFPIALSCGGTKASNAFPEQESPGGSDAWDLLASILPTLYPTGPGDQEIWERAQGDVSRLRLQGTGRGTWFAALKLLERGGGGARITIRTLVDVALRDFPNHSELAEIRRRL